MYVFVYNPLSQNRSTIVRLPVASDATFRVARIDDGKNSFLVRSVFINSQQYSSGTSNKFELRFDTRLLPPLGVVVFHVTKETDPISNVNIVESSTIRTRRLRQGPKATIELRNNLISAAFDISTGMLTGISADGVVLPINQTWGYYTSFDSALDSTIEAQNSGAYIFRPSMPDQKLIPFTPKRDAAKFLPTSVGIDVYAFFEEPWIQQVTRIQNDSPYIEIEYTVGPIPINDERGKEIVTRLLTPIINNAEFYTDSNGREFQKRKRNFRPSWDLEVFEPIAGNYYPVNAAIYIEDSAAALALMVDRSQGGTSLVDGSIEIMVQRRTLADDSRGVDEPLNETCGGMSPYPPYGTNERRGGGIIITGKHRIRVGKGLVGANMARSEMDCLFAEPIVFIGSAPISNPVQFQTGEFAGLTDALPPNILLITFTRLRDHSDNTFLIRLGHQYGPNENAILSVTQEIDLSKVFLYRNITSIIETTLTGTAELRVSRSHRINWNVKHNVKTQLETVNSTILKIYPMEVRTFIVVMVN
jgi:alpha-mannosidase